MEAYVNAVIEEHYHTLPLSVKALGGGFYGRVFLAVLPEAPFRVVIKLYLYPGLALQEETQLNLLHRTALLPMPKVYFVRVNDSLIPYDALAMEFLEGINAGGEIRLSREYMKKLGAVMIDNLIAWHNTCNPGGFGKINAPSPEKDWLSCYRRKAGEDLKKAEILYRSGKLEKDVFSLMDRAYERIDDIFYLPVTKASLIHGDYNTWNLLLSEDLSRVSGVIDPFNCCFADAEMDLYQLDNANGRDYGLLEQYSQRVQLSENFALKNCFYELFTELMHYHDAHVDPIVPRVAEEAEALRIQLVRFGII